MKTSWKTVLPRDPLPALLSFADPALGWFVRHDLLNESVSGIEALWVLPQAEKLVGRQQPDGSWRYPGKPAGRAGSTNYSLLETYRLLRLLVEAYGFDRRHPTLERAAEYLFSCQTVEGDMRGILGRQYMPYYHAALLELLIKAGYAQDARTEKGLTWLLAMRQEDGGWIIPAQLVPARQKTEELWRGAPVPPDRSRPHSHLATGMVLRAFAAHPGFVSNPGVQAAGQRLEERLFTADRYSDRQAPSYWLKFQYPFWWTSLVTALDSLSRLGFDRRQASIARGLDWFMHNQSADGLWETGYGNGSHASENRTWVGLAVCRVFKRFFDQE